MATWVASYDPFSVSCESGIEVQLEVCFVKSGVVSILLNFLVSLAVGFLGLRSSSGVVLISVVGHWFMLADLEVSGSVIIVGGWVRVACHSDRAGCHAS